MFATWDYNDIVITLAQFISEHRQAIIDSVLRSVLPVLLLILGVLWGRHMWSSGNFLTWVSVSLHSYGHLHGSSTKTLWIRTLMEVSVREVMNRNVYGEKILVNAAKRANDTFLPISEPDEWIVKNKIRSMLSAMSVTGFIAHDLGLPVVKNDYVAALVCEKRGYGLKRITVVVVKKDLLVNEVFSGDDWAIDNPHHRERLKTLKLFQERYQQNPDRFVELELCSRR